MGSKSEFHIFALLIMRKFTHPYRIFFILAALASMVFLLKINKQNFYFHYFKVIEEVEMRNSQEFSYFPSTAVLLSQPTRIIPIFSYLGFLSLGFLVICLLIRPLLTLDNFNFKVRPNDTLKAVYLTTHPIRAPQA